MINIHENTIGIWQVELPWGNWLAHVYTTEDKCILQYRFRYYRDDIIGTDSKDEKNWYEMTTRKDELDHVLEKTRELVSMMAKGFDTEVYELLMEDQGLDKFLDELISGNNSLFTVVEEHRLQ
ncbi:MAG: hypothetical protein V3S69_03130 [Dehalococcoidales bacterium]